MPAIILLKTLVTFMPTFVMFQILFRHRYRYGYKRTLAAWALVAVGSILTAVIFYKWMGRSFSPMRIYGSVAISIMFMIAVVALINDSPFKIIFAVFVSKCLVDDAIMFVRAFDIVYFHGWVYVNNLLFYYLLELLAVLLFLPLFIAFIIKGMKPMMDDIYEYETWKFIWPVPLLFYFVYRLGIYPGYFGGEFDISVALILLAYTWTGCTFLILWIIFKTVDGISARARLNESLRFSEMRLELQGKQYEALKVNIEAARRDRHDLRHHLIVLRELVRKDDKDAAEKYINDYLDNIDSKNFVFPCENYAVSAVVSHYLSEARSFGITINCSLDIPESMNMTDADCCVLFANLLENALEACRRQKTGKRFISVNGGATNNKLALVVENSFSGKIIESDGEFISSKRDEKGIGTASVRSIAKKYGGIAKFTYSDNVFNASVLLNMGIR